MMNNFVLLSDGSTIILKDESRNHRFHGCMLTGVNQ